VRIPEGVAIPPNTRAELERDMARLDVLREQIAAVEQTRLERIANAPDNGPHAMIRLLASVRGLGIDTADMLVNEVMTRHLRDRRAVARYAGITGSPDESGLRRREKGLAKAGNGRVRRGMVQLAWRWLTFQKESTLALWFRARVDGAPSLRKKMVVALDRKLLIALWRMATIGEVPQGIVMRPAA
jgi:transposase